MKKVLKRSFIILLCVAFIFIIAFSVILHNVIKTSSDIKFDKELLISATSKIEIYNNNNNLIKNNLNENNIVDFEALHDYTKNAFVSIEDKEFYKHKGLNYKRIIMSLINNIKSGYFKEGGSTISQQLIKNTHLNSDKTFTRKLKEMVLTKKLEKNFSKDDILEIYLNVIYFGNNCYGLENASLCYFNKSSKDLNINESACLAGLIKAPNRYSPITNYDNCFKRKNLVLREMKKDGFITESEFNENYNNEITLNLSKKLTKSVYEKAVIKEAEKITKLSEKELKMLGVKIYTYLDENLQNEIVETINNKSFYHTNKFGNTADSCAVVIDNETGGINAFYGKSNYDLYSIKRQPGSAIKPILVYAPALEKGIVTPESVILDEKIDYDGYSPKNVGNVYHGYVTTTEAIEQSLNIPAVKVMKEVGIENCKNFVKKVDLDLSNEGNNYALALGGFKYGMNLIDLTNTYIPFSMNGNFIKAKFIKEIKTNNGTIYKNSELKTQVLSEESAYLMNKMLIKGAINGTSKRLKDLPFEVAGKTGTVGITNTNLNTDVYSIAYTKNKTCGVWLGNAEGKSEYNLEGSNNGGTYATSMLKDVILKAHKNITPNKFNTAPSGIETIQIDEIALENEHKFMLAGENTPPVYKKTIEINKKFNNLKVSNSYTNPKPVEFEIKVINEKPQISFNAQKYLIYKIYRIEEDQTKVLETFKNKKGEISFTDETCEKDTFYNYYIECYAYNYSTFTPSAKAKSEVKKVIII